MTSHHSQDLTQFYLNSLSEIAVYLSSPDAQHFFLNSKKKNLVFKTFSTTIFHEGHGLLFPPFSLLPLLKNIHGPLIAGDFIGPSQLRTGIISLGVAANFNAVDFYQKFADDKNLPKISFWDIRRFDQNFPLNEREEQWHENDKNGPVVIPLLNFKAQKNNDLSLSLELTVAFNSLQKKQFLIDFLQKLIDLFRSPSDLGPYLKPLKNPFCSNPHFAQEKKNWVNLFQGIQGDFFAKKAGKKIVLSSSQKWKLKSNTTFQDHWAYELTQNWASSQLPSHHSFLMIHSPTHAFYSKTPEKLFLIHNSSLYLEALAGTRSRGKNQNEDLLREEELFQCPKERLEHQLVIDYFRSLFKDHDLIVGETRILKLQKIQHLYTPLLVKDWNKKLINVHYLLEELHPSPAVCGAPSVEAQKTIRENEGYDRGIYAGALTYGEGGGNQEGETSLFVISLVGIRGQLEFNSSLYLYAGAGIMKDSNPHNEWDEIQKKMQSFFSYPELIPKLSHERAI